MRITLIGRAAFGEAVLKAILNKGWEVVGVFTNPDIPNRPNPLKDSALALNIPLFQPQNWRDPKVYEIYKSLSPDLGVMAYVTDIIPISIIELPRLGTIEYHPSLLPKHRGASAINWAIINGETKTGITIFWPDAGIDTGPILLQKEVEIEPDDTAGSLYYNKLFPLGVEAMIEAIEMIEKGIAPKIPQDESQATYEPPCREEHAIIDWSQSVQKVYNLIRGTNPQPGATTYFRGKKLKIFDCEKRSVFEGAKPGEVVKITDEGFIVATKEGSILVKRVQPINSPKISATQYVSSINLTVGEILGR
ncbi:MAG: methionyl-tRNA formyltransferase [Nitrososphaerales archaeon]